MRKIKNENKISTFNFTLNCKKLKSDCGIWFCLLLNISGIAYNLTLDVNSSCICLFTQMTLQLEYCQILNLIWCIFNFNSTKQIMISNFIKYIY